MEDEDRIKELILSNNQDDRFLAANILVRAYTYNKARSICQKVDGRKIEAFSISTRKYTIIRKKKSWGFICYGNFYPDSKNTIDCWIANYIEDDIEIIEI